MSLTATATLGAPQGRTTAGQRRAVNAVPQHQPVVRCRYLASGKRGSLDRCTAEAVDPVGEIILCISHLALALELIQGVPLMGEKFAPRMGSL